ncbi:hypothetical protein K0M31_008677, partial [Melipona bicolor]
VIRQCCLLLPVSRCKTHFRESAENIDRFVAKRICICDEIRVHAHNFRGNDTIKIQDSETQ